MFKIYYIHVTKISDLEDRSKNLVKNTKMFKSFFMTK